MSSDEDENASQPMDADDDEERENLNDILDDLEFSADTVMRNDKQWLEYPKEFIQPAKMCSVNKFVQCVDNTFMHHSIHHVPTGPEYVLVGYDSPSLPTHMFNWIWAMTQINLMQQYSQCVVPVTNFTRVHYVKRGKDLVATSMKRRLVVSKGWSMDAALQTDVWFSDMPAQKSVMAEAIDEMRKNDSHYADVNPIQMLWNIIPLSYIDVETNVETRRIAHVLKTIPAPGFDLMRCLVNLSSKRDMKLRNGVPIESVLQTITEVLNYECNRNLKISGCFGRSHPLPHPMAVLEDPKSPMHPCIVLSPFLVMRKISLQLPLTSLRNLIMDGFPVTETLEERLECFNHWVAAQQRYKKVVVRWHDAFGMALKAADKTSIPEVRLPPVLINSDEECLDQIYCNMTMAFNLKKWLDGGALTLDKAEMLRLPQLAVATLTPFQYSDMCSESVDEFIRAHLGDQNSTVDETELNMRYSQDNGSWGDMPHGGMYKSARESFKTSMKAMQSDPCLLKRVKTYQNYLRAQSTIHSQAVLVDLMMSDRVLHCAQCLDRLAPRMCKGLKAAFDVQMSGAEAAKQRVIFEAYPDTHYFMRMLHILCLNNRYIRANAVNLTTLLSFMISDVLTHLGSHHETWNWMMYTVQVMGGAGHLRAMTDDHSNKTPVIFTSKPNSVGFNAIITKMFKALATLVSELLPDLTSDFLEPMRFMKLDRTTRSGVEGVSSVMFINGVKESAPSRKTFMRPIIMDEGYRSMDASALNGLVCSIPRDSDGGSGNILKSIDPGKAGGAHLQGHQRQLPGLSPFLVGMTSNSNPHTPVIGECIKTFSVVTAMFPSGWVIFFFNGVWLRIVTPSQRAGGRPAFADHVAQEAQDQRFQLVQHQRVLDAAHGQERARAPGVVHVCAVHGGAAVGAGEQDGAGGLRDQRRVPAVRRVASKHHPDALPVLLRGQPVPELRPSDRRVHGPPGRHDVRGYMRETLLRGCVHRRGEHQDPGGHGDVAAHGAVDQRGLFQRAHAPRRHQPDHGEPVHPRQDQHAGDPHRVPHGRVRDDADRGGDAAVRRAVWVAGPDDAVSAGR